MKSTRFFRRVVPIAAFALLAVFALSADAARAADTGTCEPPISTCQPVILSPDAAPQREDDVPFSTCPDGYTCACVPSCPDCDDCAADVCVPSEPECKTACDCEPGLGCFDGSCLAGFAEVACCERDECPATGQCQSRSGDFRRCTDERCKTPEVWTCDPDAPGASCGDGRECSCSASCQFCENCGPAVCVPKGTPTPYDCESDADCASGDTCECISSCEGCDDCVMQLCVPQTCDGPDCETRVRKSNYKIKRAVRRASRCEAHDQCVFVSTDTNCQGSCGAFVNRMYKRAVERFIDKVDRRICGDYQEDGCPYATPGCLQQEGVCRRGRCRAVAVSP